MSATNQIDLQVVTPERLLVHQLVDEVEIPGANGYFGVLPFHAPLLASLAIGELWYRVGEEKQYLSIAFGFAEVLPHNVTILARLAERPEEIDLARAEEARKRAEARLAQGTADVDYDRARVALTKALTRLQVASRTPGMRVGELKRMRS